MANSMSVNFGASANGVPIATSTQRAEASSLLLVQEAIAASASDESVAAVVDEGTLKGFYLLATGGDLIVKTNSDSAPDDTFALKDGVPVTWTEESAGAKPIGEDITGLYVSNSGDSEVGLILIALTDATPSA